MKDICSGRNSGAGHFSIFSRPQIRFLRNRSTKIRLKLAEYIWLNIMVQILCKNYYRKKPKNTYPINPPCLVRLKSPINAAEERLMNELSLEFPFSVLEEDWIFAEAVGRPLLSLIGLEKCKNKCTTEKKFRYLYNLD